MMEKSIEIDPKIQEIFSQVSNRVEEVIKGVREDVAIGIETGRILKNCVVYLDDQSVKVSSNIFAQVLSTTRERLMVPEFPVPPHPVKKATNTERGKMTQIKYGTGVPGIFLLETQIANQTTWKVEREA